MQDRVHVIWLHGTQLHDHGEETAVPEELPVLQKEEPGGENQEILG